MQGDALEVRVVDGRVVTGPGPGVGPVAMVWLPRDGQVIAKIPPMTDDQRWLRQVVGIRSPYFYNDR